MRAFQLEGGSPFETINRRLNCGPEQKAHDHLDSYAVAATLNPARWCDTTVSFFRLNALSAAGARVN